MDDLLLDLLLSGAIGVGFWLLLKVGSRQGAETGRAWRLILVGIAFLFVGSVLNVVEDLGLVEELGGGMVAVARDLIGDYVCFLGGALMLVFGVVGSLSTAALRDRIQRLQQQLTVKSRELSATRELFDGVMKSSLTGVMILRAVRDDDGKVADLDVWHMNGEGEQILGRAASTLTHKRLAEQIPCIKAEGVFESAVSVFDTGLPFLGKFSTVEGRETRWYEVSVAKLAGGDGIVANFADISEKKRNEEKLRHAAHHDALTGLPNRIKFTLRLEQAINRAKRFPHYRFAVLYLDFDRFKMVNDSLGHEAGDQLLLNIAARLRDQLSFSESSARPDDGHLPSRLGGDEFVVLLDSVGTDAEAIATCEQLQQELSRPHQIAGQEVVSTASIGVVFSDRRYHRPDEMLRDADTAMYEAKTTGKARHVIFDERMHQAIIERLDLEKDLRQAVEERAFGVQFEPIVRLDSGAVAGFEALIRWRHPTRGMVPPAQFIEMAEELSLIVPIGEWILNQACRALKEWRDRFPAHTALAINVNLSKQQLVHPDLIGMIRRAIEEAGIDAACLRLEVTESMIMNDLEALAPVLNQIKELGPQLVMDDFGTGHSSLSCLHRFPFDVLKIDRSFIHSVKQKRDYAAIVNAVVGVAHNLKMEVVAEGIETEDQLTLLKALDCNFGQGHFFSEPVSSEAVVEMLESDRRFRTAA